MKVNCYQMEDKILLKLKMYTFACSKTYMGGKISS
jgi:hypothetical protein